MVPQIMGTRLAGLALLLIAGSALLLPPEFLFGGIIPTLKSAKDALHLPGFTLIVICLTLLFGRKNESLVRLWIPIVIAGVLAVASELIQPLIHRSAQWQDLWANLIGIAVGAVWLILFRVLRSPLCRTLLIAALVVFFAWFVRPFATYQIHRSWLESRFPVLADFADSRMLSFLQVSRQCRTERVTAPGGDSISAVKVINRTDGERGFVTLWLPPGIQDWTGQRTLRIDLHNPGASFQLNLAVVEDPAPDRPGNWFSRSQVVETGDTALVIPLAELRNKADDRSLSPKRIQRIFFGLPNGSEEPVLFLKKIRLE